MDNDEIRVGSLEIFRGRNIFSHRPVMKMTVDIGRYDDIPTSAITGFNKTLIELLPGLENNCCSLGYEGGFLERLREGTYLAHVLEHVILEMQFMSGYDVSFGRTRRVSSSVYSVVYEYKNEVCGLECGKAAIFVINLLLRGKKADIKQLVDRLTELSLASELGPSTAAIASEAVARGIPVTRIGSGSLLRLGYGRHSRLIEATLTDATPCICADISSNKQLTKYLLSENGIPVPRGRTVYSEISAVMAAEQIGLPVVIKPLDGNQGKGVQLALRTDDEIRSAFREATKYSSGVVVERCVSGRDYRLLVVGSSVCAAAERLPASVCGDGTHTVRQLVDIINSDPRRGDDHQRQLTKIKLDSVTEHVLGRQGLGLDSVPEKDRLVRLRQTGNLSTGGTAVDCTDVVHPENAAIAVRAARAVGIDIAGIDVVTENISTPISVNRGAVVEVNTAPGIRMHLYPSVGKPRNVAKNIVDLLFPDENSGRFPIVSVTGTNGKTTVVRLIRHVLTLSGLCTGMTSTEGTFVDGKCVCRGDNSGPRSARSLLADRSIDAAVLETARGGIIRGGLGYDLADVGVITNITGDHLGLDGIETIEELAYVKALVVEAIKPGGTAVLNAGDAMTPYVLGRVKAKKSLFALDEGAFGPFDGTAVRTFVRGGTIITEDSGETDTVISVKDIPLTVGGRISCNVENCLAAAAALHALRIPAETIAEGLRCFEDNPGRFEYYVLGKTGVMLDYGHNPDGYTRTLETLRGLGAEPLTGIIGAPGDRADSELKEIGGICAGTFGRLFIKEDADLRGREPGEVSRLLTDGALAAGYGKENITVIPCETDALKAAVANAIPGELIAIFYEEADPLREILKSCGARRSPLCAPDKPRED
jgi:cyanophycin synthetase